MNEKESMVECFRSSQIFHAIPAPNFSALWNSTYFHKLIRIRLDAGKNRLEAERAWFLGEESEAGNRVGFDSLGQNQRVFEAFSLILPRVRLRRIPSKFGLGRLNLPMSLNPFPNALSCLVLCFYAITVLGNAYLNE